MTGPTAGRLVKAALLAVLCSGTVMTVGAATGFPAYVSAGLSIHKSFGSDSTGPLKGWFIGPEISFWPTGFLGLESGVQYGFTRKELVWYAEAGTGFGAAGVQFGPWFSFSFADQSRRVGTQASLWAGYIYGFADVRARMSLDGETRSLKSDVPIIGLTAKYPLYHGVKYPGLP
jgi:hypothetical protein